MKLSVLILCVVMSAAPSQATPPVRSVPSVDLARYAGTWFEVARFPNWFQKKCVSDVVATYARRPDSTIEVGNSCRTAGGETTVAQGRARVVEQSGNARLKVRFAPAALSWLPFVWGDYWVIGLADDYSWAVVGDPSRSYLWILSRTPAPAGAEYEKALTVARQNGFDVTRLVKTAHTAGWLADAHESALLVTATPSTFREPSPRWGPY